MQVARRKTPFLARLRLAVALMLMASSLLACSTGGYFIPPRATDTPAPSLASLSQPTPADTPEPTSEPVTIPTSTADILTAEALHPQPTFTPPPVNTTPILYYTQAAETLPVIAVRFGVNQEEITSPEHISPSALLTPNQLLIIPRRLVNTTSSQRIFPDSEVVYSPASIDFDINAFVTDAGGYLSTYEEWFKTTQTDSGAEVVQRVAIENSINPRLLLALLEYQSGLVFGHSTDRTVLDYPMGHVDLKSKGLYRQLVWAVNQLSVGYYSWREGRLLELNFPDGGSTRLAPDLNAGSAALQYYFSRTYSGADWLQAIDMEKGLPAVYERMFGSPWMRAQSVEPLYPPGLTQPGLILPFEVNRVWSYTGGPHGAWEHDGSYAALDFAPASSASGCLKSNAWVTAAASGLVVRSGNGVIVLDLDGDGYEQTGWVVLYLHVSIEARAPVGTWVGAGDRLGHPSCEGGLATGTHVHIARKYNGEWIAADGPMPFNLSGWVAHAGDVAYQGMLTRENESVLACTCTSLVTNILRTPDDPHEAGF